MVVAAQVGVVVELQFYLALQSGECMFQIALQGCIISSSSVVIENDAVNWRNEGGLVVCERIQI